MRKSAIVLCCIASFWVTRDLCAGSPQGIGKMSPHLIGYVGGIGVVYKIDVTRQRVASKSYIQGQGLNIVKFLSLSADGTRLFVTGEQMDVPVLALDTSTLEPKARMNLAGVSLQAVQGGRFDSYGFQASLDGKTAATFVSHAEDGFWLQFVEMPGLIPKARHQTHAFDVGHQSAFVDEGRKFIVLHWHRPSDSLSVVDVVTGKILRAVPLPATLRGNVPASGLLAEAAALYLVEAGADRWLLSDRQNMYVYIARDASTIEVADVRSGRVLNRFSIPGGPQDVYAATLTPDGKEILISRGPLLRHGKPGELVVLDRPTAKIRGRLRLQDGATSNVVFRYE